MTLIDSDLTPEIEQLEPDIRLGYELQLNRERLHIFLDKPQALSSDEEYAEVMSEYLNTLQKLWFERSADVKYEVIQELPKRIKAEAEIFFGSAEPIEDISKRLEAYSFDETAEQHKLKGISHYPRATTLTMLDIFDEYR